MFIGYGGLFRADYLSGQQALLNDCFGEIRGAGAAEEKGIGCFAYQELPGTGRKAGVTGRGLEGLTDSVLKVLGV